MGTSETQARANQAPNKGIGFTAYHSTLAAALGRHAAEYLEFYAENFKKHGDMVEAFDSLEERRIVLVLLTASLVEALANLYLALKLDRARFEFLEMSSPVDKWVIVPGLVLPFYEFPKDGQMYQDLVSLFNRRNGITHMKPEVDKDGKRIHPGNLPKLGPEHKAALNWLSLPLRLLDHLCKYDTESLLHIVKAGIEIDLATGKRRALGSHAMTPGKHTY